MLDDDPQMRFLLRQWANGGSALPAVRRLLDNDCPDEAAVIARVALAKENCADRDSLQAALLEAASPPDGWLPALEEFARDPGLERWELLMRFVPEEVFYQRFRTTIHLLQRLGCDGNILFGCATGIGMTPDVFDLATSGTVDPEVIAERGAGSPARATWLGLAAQASFARGDRFGTIRYLREACREEDSVLAWASITEIREAADEALNQELDKVGVPRV